MRSITALVSVLFLTASSANAITIASWNNNGQLGDQVSTVGTGSANVTASNMVRGAGLSPTQGANSINSTGWGGSDAGDYFEFGFTVDAGFQVTLDSLLIGTRSSATGPGTIGVFTSLDGFATSLTSIVQPSTVFVNSTIDLSSLGTVSGSFQIRLFEIGNTQAAGVGDTAGTGTFRITNFGSLPTQITGTTSQITAPIPEPASAILFTASLLIVHSAARRRGNTAYAP